MKFLPYYIYVFVAAGLLLSCQKDDFSNNVADRLAFSADTLSFDTVFTTIGTRTERIIVYNKNNNPLKISQIYLEKGAASAFKINVDGTASANQYFTDIEILAHDSIYIFVTATINPNNQNSPLIVEDKIIFSFNGNTQNVHLEAIGQDVWLLRNTTVWQDSTLAADKPLLIYGSLAINNGVTLTVAAGAKMYFHAGASLDVYGTLNAAGTRQNPILMRGDRLDNINFSTPVPYNHVAGQWSGVFLMGENVQHILRNVILNSSDVGVFLYSETLENAQMPRLLIDNCRLTNFSFYGLCVFNGNVKAINTEISNSGTYTVFLNGGKHDFVHTTVANFFGSYQSASREKETVAVLINNTEQILIDNKPFLLAPSVSSFYNSIIAGSMDTEFTLITENTAQYAGKFSHSYIKAKDTINYPNSLNIRWSRNDDKIFASTEFKWEKTEKRYYDFRLDSASAACNIGDIQTVTDFDVQFDFAGNDRMADGRPDAGAYEWMPK